MRSFKNKLTGVILAPKNAWAIEQLEKSPEYEEVKGKANAKTNSNDGEKAIKDYTKKELVAYLTEKGIECNEDMKKDELLLLVPENEE